MKVFDRFAGYRIFFVIFGFLIIGILVFILFYFFSASWPPYQFISNLLIIYLIFVLLIFLVALLGISDSLKAIDSIKKMFSFTEEIKKGNFGAEIEIKRKDEIGKLAQNLELMKKNLKSHIERLEKEKERFSSIIDNIGEAILVINEKRNIVLANPASQRILGLKQEEILQKKYFEILKLFDGEKETPICQEEKKDSCPIEKAISFGKRIDISQNIYLLNKYGRKIFIAGSIYPVFPFLKEHTNLYIFSFHDVSIEREIDRMKDEFISIASHQLRTPLSSIRWYVEMLLAGDAGKLAQKQINFLKDIYDSVLTAINLVNNLLDVQKIESGRIVIDFQEIDLREVVERVISQLKPLAMSSNAKIIKKIENFPLKVRVDYSKVSLVFLNIISNAITYNKGRGDIIVNLKKTDHEVLFSCKDSGIGIPPEEQKNIFKKFYRATNTAGIGAPGYGLGLYICKSYVEHMNGKIWFYSEGKDKGTTFFVSFPLIL